MRSVAGLLALAAVLTAGACSGGAAGGRAIVLGLDGLDPATVDLLMSEGKLPNFARLRQEGAYGRPRASEPLLSPVLWTTVATGKTPDRHGIGHFVAVNQTTGEPLPVTSEMRRVRAVWDILSDADRRVAVVGWWATWPAETVNGAIVSDHTCYHFLFPEGGTGAPDPAGLTHPPALYRDIAPLIRRPGDLGADEVEPFIRVDAAELAKPFDFDDEVSHFKWALATAESYRRIGLELWRRERPDLLLVYIEGTDSVSHLFGHLFRATDLSGELARQQERFGQAVEQMYLYADRIVGEYMEAMDDDTTLVVLSDHGFQLGVLPDDPSTTRDLRRVSERYHRNEGILYMYGDRVRRRTRIQQPSPLDVVPTLLALTGLPPAADMPGRVLTEALDVEPPGPPVATYEAGAPGTAVAGSHAAGAAGDQAVDPQILERLRSLGYLGNATSPQGDRNLAAIQFQAGRYEEAAEIYTRLIEESPEDPSLYTSLAGALGAMERYDEARAHLEKAIELEPLNPEAHHNLAVIHERAGDREAAIDNYRTALLYHPGYEPSRQALLRLVGSAEVRVPRSDAERLAVAMGERAAEAARRGDYDAAWETLVEAERIAPTWVVTYQYQSNVAYLRGDVAGAVRALEKALEIEPGNALFKANLEWLQGQQLERRP